jgi:V/A-type H+-transporting ATPase subunit I
MFKAKPMSRLLIAASREQLEPVIRELYRHHIFHIEDFVEERDEAYEGYAIGMPLEYVGSISQKLLKLRGIENIFDIRPEDVEIEQKQKIQALKSRIDHELPEIEGQVGELVSRRASLETRIREFEQKVRDLEPFSVLPHDLSLFRGYEQFAVFAGHIPRDVDLPVPAEKFFSTEVPGNMLVVIVSAESREEVEKVLLEAQFHAVPVPVEEGSAPERIAWYNGEISRITAEIEQIGKSISDLKMSYSDFVVACDELLTAEVERAEAPLRFATTEEAFIVEGWVPKEHTAELLEALRRATSGGKIFITELEIDPEKESVPIEYENPSFSRPTELLMDIHSRPKYLEVDPTVMVSLVFPIFFGIILGDVGYGLLLLGMSFALRRFLKSEAGNKLLDVLRNASISSIILGVLYSEFFGFALPWDPLIFSRHINLGGHGGGHGPMVAELIVLSAWIGIMHLTLGRSVGVINAKNIFHGSHRTKAIIANLGWLGVMWGLLFLIWSSFALPIMPDFTGLPGVVLGMSATALFGAILLVGGIVGIAQESALELVELPTLISHTLSYARLVAVGLSSVAIAGVINLIAIGMMIEPQLEHLTPVGVIFIIAGIAVWLAGHLLNTALGLLGGGLHSLRLHYVEFFTKFYKGGGIKFSPFGMKRRFTEE